MSSKPPSRRESKIVVPNQPSWHGRAAARLVHVLGSTLAATWRIRFEDRSGYLPGNGAGPVIFGVWHNRLAISMAFYAEVKRRRPTSGLAALISASRDGALLATTLGHFGVQAVRGSSSRRGAQALLELTTWTEKGYHIAITPDGPRGPKYTVQEGIISLAQISGLPILPVGAHIHSKKCFRSWDQFQVPLPFSRCDLIAEQALHVPRDADNATREELRLELQRRMLSVSVD